MSPHAFDGASIHMNGERPKTITPEEIDRVRQGVKRSIEGLFGSIRYQYLREYAWVPKIVSEKDHMTLELHLDKDRSWTLDVILEGTKVLGILWRVVDGGVDVTYQDETPTEATVFHARVIRAIWELPSLLEYLHGYLQDARGTVDNFLSRNP